MYRKNVKTESSVSCKPPSPVKADEALGMRLILATALSLSLISQVFAQTAENNSSSKSTKPAEQRPELRAQLTAARYTTLSTEIGAKINSIPLREGSFFSAGQVLVTFDCAVLVAQLQKAQAELTSAEHTLKANRDLQRLNAVGQLELDVSEAAWQKSKAEVNANAAVVSKCEIKAPFSGRIADQKVREQQYVQIGQPLLEILDDSSLELEVLVPSSWLTWLKMGSGVRVSIDETGKTYGAQLIRIGARVDPVSQSVKVAARINGRHPELVSGMSGQVQIGGK